MPFVGSRQDCKGAWAAGRQSQALACTHASLGIGTVLCSPPPRPRSACPTWQAWRPHGPSLTIASPPSRPPCCTRPPAGFRGPSAPGQSPGSVGGLWWPAGWGSLPAGHGAGTHHGARLCQWGKVPLPFHCLLTHLGWAAMSASVYPPGSCSFHRHGN